MRHDGFFFFRHNDVLHRLRQDFLQRQEVGILPAVIAKFRQAGDRKLDKVMGIRVSLIGKLGDLIDRRDQPAAQRLTSNDLNVIGVVGDQGVGVHDVTQIRHSAGFFQRSLLLQLVAYRDHIHGLALRIQLLDRLENHLMGGYIEVFPKKDRTASGQRVLGIQAARKHRHLRIVILRRHTVHKQLVVFR